MAQGVYFPFCYLSQFQFSLVLINLSKALATLLAISTSFKNHNYDFYEQNFSGHYGEPKNTGFAAENTAPWKQILAVIRVGHVKARSLVAWGPHTERNVYGGRGYTLET